MVILHSAGSEAAIPELKIVGFLKNDATVMPLLPLKSITRFMEKKVTTLMVTHNLRFAVEYGSRLVMMHEGKCVMDIKGEEKKNAKVDDLLSVFNEISIESGN